MKFASSKNNVMWGGPHNKNTIIIPSVHFSHSVVSDSLWPYERQHARPPCPSPTPGVHPKPCPLSWWCHPTISSSVIPFSSCPQSFRSSGFFKWVSSLHQVAKVFEFQLQHQSFQWTLRTDLFLDGLVGSPCSPRDSLRLLIFLSAILIPACASSSPAFLMMYSAYKLTKQSDSKEPWCTPFPIWNQSVVLCPVLTAASWPVLYRKYLKGLRP